MKILVVDDDVCLLQLLTIQLTAKGYSVVTASDGKEGLRQAYKNQPDLIILDVMLSDITGFDVCERLREFSDVPILFLSARNTDSGILRGFGAGADDFLRKPFNMDELIARIGAILSRTSAAQNISLDHYDDGCLEIDIKRKTVFLNGKHIRLSSTEFRLLFVLIQHRGKVVPHEFLLNGVWGPGFSKSASLLSLYIRYLRNKLEDDPSNPKYICTDWGIGYWFTPD